MLSGYKKLATLQSFNNLFDKSKALIYLKNASLSVANSPMIQISPTFKTMVYKTPQVKSENDKGHDIYFIPNLGGTKATDIKKITCCFVDLDAGKNAAGKYLTKRSVDTKKRAMLARITKCPLKPSIVVETRNGYQLYWLLDKSQNATSATRIAWSVVQNKICNFFKDVGADSKVLKVNQILRVPTTYWNKKYTGISPFLCEAYLKSGKVTYKWGEITKAFIDQSGVKAKSSNYSYGRSTVKHGKPVKETGHQNNWDVSWSDNLGRSTITVSNAGNGELFQDISDYLTEVQKILHFGGHKFLAKQAVVLNEKVLNAIAANL